MAEKNISFVFSLKGSDKFNTSLKSMNNEMKTLQNGIKQSSNDIISHGKNVETLAQKYQSIQKAIDTSKQKVDLFKNQIEKQNSVIEQSKSKLNNLATEKEKLNKKYDEAVEKYGKESDEVKDLEQQLGDLNTEYSKVEKTLTSQEKSLENYEVGLSNAQTELSNLETSLSQCGTELEKQSNKFVQASEDLQKYSDKLKNLGGSLSGAGDTLLKISAPITAFSGYAIKASMDFESAMSNVKAISGATGDDLNRLTDIAKEMGAKTSFSATECADALSYMALAGWDTEQMCQGLEPILRLAEGGNLDLATASDLVTDSMSALGLTTEDLTHYLDVCAQAQRKSNTTADQMLEAYIGVGGTLKELNVPMEESATWLGVLANRGIKGSEAGNALSSTLINLTSGAGQAGQAMEELGISAFDSEGNFIGIEGTLQLLNDALANCTEEQRNTYLAMIGGKSNIDTLNALLSGLNEEYGDLKTEIEGADGALNEVAETMQDNVQGNITKLKSAFEGLGIEVGEKLLPYVTQFIEGLQKLVQWFGDLDEGTQQAIIKTGLFTAGLGAGLKVTGGFVSAIGDICGGLGGLVGKLGSVTSATATISTATGEAIASTSTWAGALGGLSSITLPLIATVGTLGVAIAGVKGYFDTLDKPVTTAKEDLNLFERAVLAINDIQPKTREELEATGLVYKEFGENFSDSFKEAVEEARVDIAEFNIALSEINLDGVFTEEEKNNLESRVKTAVDSAISAVDSKTAEMKNSLTELFSTDGILSEEETQIIQWWTTRGDKEKEEATRLQQEINEIEQRAFAEGRALTPEEEQAIIERYDRIKQIELMAKATNSDELKYAEIDFQNQIATLDAEGAEKLLMQKFQQADELKLQKQNEFEMLRQQAMEGYDQMSEEEKAQADRTVELINEAEQKYLEEDRQYRENLVTQATEGNEELNGVINKYTGERLSDADLQAQKQLEIMKGMYDGMDGITESGMYSLYDKTSGTWHDVMVTVDEATGEVIGTYDVMTKKVGGYTQEVCDDLAKEGQAFMNTGNIGTEAYKTLTSSTVNSSGQIVDANGRVVGSLRDVKTATDGTRTGIVNLNGTPVAIKVNKDGTISVLNDISRTADNASRDRYSVITFEESGLDWISYKAQSVMNSLGGGGGARGEYYAKGTPYAQGGLATVNENGWELVDSPDGKDIPMLAQELQGDMAYLPQGSRVQTHLNSTAQMRADIETEVSKQLSRFNNSDLTEIVKAIYNEIKNQEQTNDIIVTNNNSYNVTTNTEYDEKRFEQDVETLLLKDLRRFGKVKGGK